MQGRPAIQGAPQYYPVVAQMLPAQQSFVPAPAGWPGAPTPYSTPQYSPVAGTSQQPKMPLQIGSIVLHPPPHSHFAQQAVPAPFVAPTQQDSQPRYHPYDSSPQYRTDGFGGSQRGGYRGRGGVRGRPRGGYQYTQQPRFQRDVAIASAVPRTEVATASASPAVPTKKKFVCEPCEKDFDSVDQYSAHLAGHVHCDAEGCPFNACPRAMRDHIERSHPEFARFVKRQETPEEIAAWREARRKQFPTKENVRAKDEAFRAALERGELPPRGRGRGRGRGMWRGRGAALSSRPLQPWYQQGEDGAPEQVSSKVPVDIPQPVVAAQKRRRQTSAGGGRCVPLLEKLLEKTVRREKSAALQCLRYISRHEFLDAPSDDESDPMEEEVGELDEIVDEQDIIESIAAAAADDAAADDAFSQEDEDGEDLEIAGCDDEGDADDSVRSGGAAEISGIPVTAAPAEESSASAENKLN